MTERSTQVVQEVLEKGTNTNIRSTQVVQEVLEKGTNTNIRSTQVVQEVLEKTTNRNIRSTQVVQQVIRTINALPVISGAIFVGQTLSTTDGIWATSPAPTFTYQWKRNGTNISGATANTYVLVSGDAGTIITVTVTATNVLGSASATSLGVGPISTNTLWTPAALGADVWAWWQMDLMSQADTVAVPTVTDSSGNSRTLTTIGSPTAKANAQNGLKSLNFAGGGKCGTFASTTGFTAGSIFAVNKAAASPSSTNFGGLCDCGSDSQVNHYTYSGTVYSDFLSNSRKGAGSVTVNVWHQVMLWSASNDWGHAMDGTNKFTTTSNTVAGLATSYLASDTQYSSWSHQGEFGEVVILQNKPTTANRQNMEGYLAWKWGLTASLPAGHPYKSVPPTIAAPPPTGFSYAWIMG